MTILALLAIGNVACSDGIRVVGDEASPAGDTSEPGVGGGNQGGGAATGGSSGSGDSGGAGGGQGSGQGSGESGLLSLAPHDDAFHSTHYSGSAQCSACHDGLSDEAGNDVSIVADWSASLMANATRDPYWMAKVAYELQNNPAISEELNDTCSRCHAPMASDAASKSGQSSVILGPQGLLSATNEWFDHAMDGVSCTLCHQVEDDGRLGTQQGSSGNFSVAQKATLTERPAYGQYSDPQGAFMQAQVQYTPQFGAHLSTSASCGACHDLRTPAVDASGEFVDGAGSALFPEQMIFTEWRNSAYAIPGGAEAQRCQDCHMPQVPGTVRLATRGGGVAREKFARHGFLGPNTVMQTMLMENRDALGIVVPADVFERSIQQNREFLQQGAGIQLISATLQGTELLVEVGVRHRAGHKLPSGFISRRVFVHLVVSDAAGNVVFESGHLNDDGSITGVDSDADPDTFEPHHELITAPDQVQVYEAVMSDNASQVNHSLVRATGYLKDNRLLPRGLAKAAAPDEIAVAGSAAQDADFDAGGDTLRFQIALPGTGPYTVAAELVYQPLAYGHLQDLFAHTTGPEVNSFRTWHAAQKLKAEVLGSASVEVR